MSCVTGCIHPINGHHFLREDFWNLQIRPGSPSPPPNHLNSNQAYNFLSQHQTHFGVRQIPVSESIAQRDVDILCVATLSTVLRKSLFCVCVYDGSSKFCGDSLWLKTINQKIRVFLSHLGYSHDKTPP